MNDNDKALLKKFSILPNLNKYVFILKTILNMCLFIMCWVNEFMSSTPMWKDVWFVLGMIMLFRLIEGIEE